MDLKNFEHLIGNAWVVDGHISGKVVFIFNKKGLNIHFTEVDKFYNYKQLKEVTFSARLLSKIKEGSKLAKGAAFLAATNSRNKNIGQQIAMSEHFREMGRDKVVEEHSELIGFTINNKPFTIRLNEKSYPDIRKDLNLAYNNPLSFFKRVWKNKKELQEKSSNQGCLSMLLGIVGFLAALSIGGVILAILGKEFDILPLVLIFPLLFVYFISKYNKSDKKYKDLKTKTNKIESSKEFKDILKSLK